MAGNPRFGQQPNLLLSRMFTGRPVGSPAMGSAPLNATVVGPAVDQAGRPAVAVTVGGFGKVVSADAAGGTTGLICSYEPRYGKGTTALVPPAGTACIVSFPTNGAASPGTNPGASGVVVAFLGWPD